MGILVTPDQLKVAAAICGICGSLLLAFRVAGILNALTRTAIFHERSIDQLIRNDSTILHLANSDKTVIQSQRNFLLYLGFGLFVLSGCLQLASLIA